MSSNPTLILATRNAKKAREMLALLAPPWMPDPILTRLQLLTVADFANVPDVDEDADTFAANARKKAAETSRHLHRWVIADDSGLAVDALDGAPGVLSARYAGTHGDDTANNQKLLDALQNIPDNRRDAAFVCALAVSDPDGAIVAEAQAACRGRIIHEPRGPGGFGYDPLFLIPEYHKTFGELTPLVKHHLSHRARAFTQLRPRLRRLIAEGGLN